MTEFSLDFPYAYSGPSAEADLRRTNSDFMVFEDLGFELAGEGEHVFLHVQKDGDNTEWLARQIAKLAGVESRDVGYCGQKDRHAITRQWFSVYLPKGDDPDWASLSSDSVHVIETVRHRQKLRRGQHRANQFVLWLRDVTGDRVALEYILTQIAKQGVPNYFGEQRFGIDAGNLHAAERMLVAGSTIKNRSKKAMVLSAARSWLFNQVLAARVENGSWFQVLEGEITEGELPTGPLWGRGRLASSDEVLALESDILNPWQHWCEPLEFTGLKQDRRALVSRVSQLDWQWQADDLRLQFELPVGAYATAVVRELARVRTVLSE
ncbi:tRNA pseudouridine(13) synthase TruD [Gilvimarinus agarilyticus]|uniref:tRNA pseudouridine(13) synthase TruD n=1 Tax=unclassified Gilvimarinus TaxID=2642066 RepID=UPI001C08ECAC|nr:MULTISPECIES: tRNA pseudouridine(13) synthase TruD [unclassified Gilvimarinus]MBU2886159.1 tRNA pseudouridine(13) synthase TruD [Gilvimarinus agarilyticus]MDO6570869.1 tRNA pseudouridine(13) synthase TruD [Gilvimarinus sp. 2_MG-2023]MDO6747037.1 tRNA pseudouridine(13) synthase TruD [Gilvimarinus sp. 1_MG-2023]